MLYVGLMKNRLERIDIFAREETDSDYIGKTVKPKLLGYVYADVQPLSETLSDERSGKVLRKKVKLILRPDAGIKCGDFAAVYGKNPDFEITEVTRFSDHISATAVNR